MAKLRHEVIQYMESRQGAVALFDWKPEDQNQHWSHTITEEDASILFVKQVLVTAGRDFSLPKPSRRKRRGSNRSRR